MDRAVKFYEDIFDVKVSSKDERMSSFEFENITFLLYNPKIDNETISNGSNVIPNIQVEDINKMLELIKNKNCEIILPLEKIGKYNLFQAKDTEGNIIEFYQIVE
ncbi:VOC family protein [Candidatus Woesearchaeota archaeon]|nr:MAG: VOC family protein [Candidatus Woesearchaeota archaeon]